MLLPEKILSRKEEITKDFLQLIEQHVGDLMGNRADKRYTATDFAKLLFIHPRHLTNTLKLTTGKSPCDFMEERILSEAQTLLKETDLPIADVGRRFAYDDPTNFTKFFKNMGGVTPLQYRKGLLENLKD
jgi:AraC family transcriptional regulator of adaptative response / methylphosphotriester-DNA alkyltransferase methyltransferase